MLAPIDFGDRVSDDVAVSPNGKTLYVATRRLQRQHRFIVDSEITKISTTTNKIIGAVRKLPGSSDVFYEYVQP